MNELSILNSQSTIKSTELVDIINEFRKAEGDKSELLHKNFMEKIRKEIKALKKLNLEGKLNFQLSYYINSRGKNIFG